MHDADKADPALEADPHLDVEGPLFYTLPQSVQDALTAHFALHPAEFASTRDARGRDGLMAA